MMYSHSWLYFSTREESGPFTVGDTMQLSLRITFPRPNRRNHLRSIVVALAACTALGTTPARAGSWVTCPQGESRTNCENRQGSVDTSHWKLDYFADKNHIIEGYASKTSVNYKNDTIAFYVNAPNASRYDLEIFRMGWYGGLGARRVYQRLNQIPTTQSPCTLPNPPAPLQCNWQAIVPEISLATDFSSPVDGPVSGYYLVKLSSHYPDNAIAQSYIIFVVREDLVPRT